MKRTVVGIVLAALVATSPLLTEANAKVELQRTRKFKSPAAKVYAATVQVASAYYDLKSAIKEGCTVTFLMMSSWNTLKGWAMTAICHEDGEGQTLVTLSIVQNESGSILGVDKQKDKLAKQFWSRLDSALKMNEQLQLHDMNAQPQRKDQ